MMKLVRVPYRKAAAVFASCLVLLSTTSAQDFSGYRTSNYAGVSGVFFNPANIADSRHRWDVNLFGAASAIGNNNASFRLRDVGKTSNLDSIKEKIFAEGQGGSSGFAIASVMGPSVFFNLDKKSALALTSRARVMSNIIDMDGKLAKQLIDADADNTGFPYTIASANNMLVNANGWTEFGVSYARELYSKGHHYLKGGVSLKYLAGAANATIQLNRLNGTINLDLIRDDAYLTNASGSVGMHFGGVKFSDDFEASSLLAFESSGFGADLGLVYEYRPDTMSLNRDLNKYKFRFGVALLDAGSINYNRDLARSGGYAVHISPSQRFYLSSLAEAGIDNFKDTLNKYPQFFTPDANAASSSYQVAMPANLQINADYHVNKGFYINLATQLGLVKSRSKIFSSQYYNSVSLTPRIESSRFGLYVPLTYHSLTQFTAGASIRIGGFFIGSGTILSAALTDTKGADVFVGFRFGSLQKSRQ